MKSMALPLALVVAGCATRSVSVADTTPVPASRVLAPRLLQAGPNTGGLILKRDSGLMGAACRIRVSVDAVPVADLGTSEKVELFLPAGEHVLGATATGICGGGMSETAVVITAGRQKIYRVSSGQSGDVRIQPSAQ